MVKIWKTKGAWLLCRKIDRLVAKGVLRKHIAGKLRMSPSTLGHITSERRRPTVDQLLRIEHVLKIKGASWTRRNTK